MSWDVKCYIQKGGGPVWMTLPMHIKVPMSSSGTGSGRISTKNLNYRFAKKIPYCRTELKPGSAGVRSSMPVQSRFELVLNVIWGQMGKC